MTHFKDNCFTLAQENTFYRKVLFTTENSQLVLMCVTQKDAIPQEIHKVDQIFVIVSGQGEAVLNGSTISFKANDTLIVPAGTKHTIKNTGPQDLKLFTIYAPPQHAQGTIHATHADEREEKYE